jgi:AcrR family transcriptional regulator
MNNALQHPGPRSASGAGLAVTPPRERILAAARELFYRQGIRAVGVDAIAEAADTNKMTLYRHFSSKDELVAACLSQIAEEDEQRWLDLATAHRGDPKGHLLTWLGNLRDKMLAADERGCPFLNAAVELPDKDHPARRIIETFKNRRRLSIIDLCRSGDFAEPDRLAEEIFLMIEGACVSLQSVGPSGPASRMVEMATALIRDHERRGR